MERGCYPGPAGTAGVGLCRAGRQRCVDRGGATDWGPCEGFIIPSPEVCDRLDNDCNGMVDDGLVLGDQCRSARALPALGGTVSGTTCCADVTTNFWHRGTPDVFFVAGGSGAFRATVTVSPGFHVYNVLRDCAHTEVDDCAPDIDVSAGPGQRVWVGVVREDPGCGAFTLRVDPARF
jgi:hypothetical protein